MTEPNKFVDCPDCRGSGEQLEVHPYPHGPKEVMVSCKYCAGEGQFDEGDYLIMKLEGNHGFYS